jgi:hypothetical protein
VDVRTPPADVVLRLADGGVDGVVDDRDVER